MKHEEAISEVLRLLDDNKKRQFPFLTEKEESAVRALLEGFEAALGWADLFRWQSPATAALRDARDGYDDWRGPCAENRRKEK